MNGPEHRFNINFDSRHPASRRIAALLAAWACLVFALSFTGCRSAEERENRKKLSTISLHLESNQDATEKQVLVPIYRKTPVHISVLRQPFLDTANVLQATVVDHPGQGIVVALQMDRQGTLILNNVTSAYRGRRIAVFAQFDDARWIAAPVANQRITDGVLAFTPDANKEEAERLVLGLNNAARKIHGKAATTGAAKP